MTGDLTKGRVFPLLVRFTLPLILGNLLQLTYNAVDSIIVGRFVGAKALAAVAGSNPVVTLVILFEQGICLGAGILIGTLYGAKQYEKLRRQVATGLTAGFAFSSACAVLIAVLAPFIMRLLQADAAFYDLAVLYLRIVSAGLIFNFIYNYYASVLRAMGDSKSPLLFLGVSAGLNVLGDLFFIVVLHLGAAGAAIATVTAEALSGFLCAWYVRKRFPELEEHSLKDFDPQLMRTTLSYGLTSALQQCTVQMGKIGIQGIVNTMGVAATAAFGAVNRADDLTMVVEQNIGHAMTSVMAQNKGAGKKDRMKEAFFWGMVLEVVYGVLCAFVFFLLAEPIMGLFVREPEVIEVGTGYLRLIAFMYILPALTNGIQGYFRGIGDLRITLVSSLMNMATRVLAAIPLVFIFHMGMDAIPWSYMVGWFCMMLYEVPFLVRAMRDGGTGKGDADGV